MDFAVAVAPSSTGVGLQHCCGAGLVAGAGAAAGGHREAVVPQCECCELGRATGAAEQPQEHVNLPWMLKLLLRLLYP